MQGFIVLAQLLDDGVRLGDRVDFGIEGGEVDQMQQQMGTLQMAQELVPQAGAFGGPFDQSGNIGDHEAAVLVGTYHAQAGGQRGEGVIAHLGTRGRDGADEGGFARIRHAQQAHVGKDLELQLQAAPFAGFAQGALARSPVDAGLEMDVAQTTPSAACNQYPLAVLVEVGDQLTGFQIGDHRAHRHAQGDVIATLAVAVTAATVLAALGGEGAGIAEVDQRVEVAVSDCKDAAAPAAVAAIRATARDVFFTAKGCTAAAAIARDDFDSCFVKKLHDGYASDLTKKPYRKDRAFLHVFQCLFGACA